MKNLPTLWWETEEENRTRINQWLLKERYWWKIVDEKSPDPGGVLGEKPTPYDWDFKSRGSRDFEGSFNEGWMEVTYSHVQSHAVTCIAAGDFERGSYPNSSKNTIKFKCSSVCLNSFVSAIGWLSLLLFRRSSRLYCWSSHQWCGVNSRRSRSWLVRMIFVKQANEFSEVLDCWSWLPGILFL